MADKRKTRMYEPWGYMEERNYNSTENAMESDFEAFLVGAAYNRDDNKIHFTNKDGEEKATIDVSEFIKSDKIVEKAWYEDGKIYIKFTNGDLITIDVKELIDEKEFADGLQVIDGVVSIKLDPTTERWLTVSQDGLKVSGIQAEIDRLDDRIDQEIADRIADVDAEEARAIGEETRIEAKLDQEIADRIADVDAEETRAIAEETRIEAKLDQEITRATQTEQSINHRVDTLNDELDAEESRAEAAEQEIRTLLTKEISDRIADVNEEEARAKAAEQALDEKIDQETEDRIADVDEEETRAKAAEATLDAKIDQEIADREADVDAEQTRAEAAEADLQAAISDEETRATAAEQALDGKIDQEIADREADVDAEERRALSAETDLQASIEDEGRRAQDAEKDLDEKIDEAISAFTAGFQQEAAARESADNALQALIEAEVEDRKTDSIASAEYDEDSALIKFFNINDELVDTIDANKFIKDGMIDSVSIETTGGTSYLVIVWNTDAGKETTRIDIGDLFEADNYYTKVEIDDIIDDIDDDLAELDVKIDNSVSSITASIAAEQTRATGVEQALQTAITEEETRATGVEALKANAADVYTKGEVDGKETALQNGIDSNAAAIATKAEAADVYTKTEVDEIKDALLEGINVNANAILAERDRAISAETDLEVAVSGKADANTVYTQEEVDALLLAKENEIYNLTKIVGDIGGAVTYELPSQAGKSFNTLMNNNGTVKLTDDVTTGRFGPGITAKNTVKLNLNSNDLTVTGLTTSSAQPAIMSRGTQNITIYGKGTIDAGGGVCIEANGVDSVINLTGSTTVYQNDRSGAELIYCYAGTINITNGTFKNLGENKGYMLNCYDANYAAGKANIIVTGGKFYDFNPADNKAEGEHTSFVPEGYHVETSTDGESTVYTVKKDS